MGRIKRMMMMTSTVLCLFLSVLLLCRCGGSDGASDVVTVGVLEAGNPIAVNSTFRYDFSRIVNIGTVNAETFFLVPSTAQASLAAMTKEAFDAETCDASAALPGSITCPSLWSCMMSPSTPLEYNTEYTVCLTTDIQYADGSAFEGYSKNFLTASGGIFSIGGTVSGLDAGETLVVQNNGADDLSLTENGSFVFATAVADGATYAVTVSGAPEGKTCTVNNGSGIVVGDDVTDIAVVCSVDTFSVGGTVTGLTAGDVVVLQNNDADDLSLTEDGSFVFATAVADGAAYAVAVSCSVPLTRAGF